jgi:hypothetical protein
MLKGEAFSDVSAIFVGSRTGIQGTSSFNFFRKGGVDVLSIDLTLLTFNSYRINVMISTLNAEPGNTPKIILSLLHGDTPGDMVSVQAKDIIGPVDDDGVPTVEHVIAGDWKRIEGGLGDPTVPLNALGDNIYSVGYIGRRRYIASIISVIDAALTAPITAICTITSLFVPTGKASSRYPLTGVVGGT